MLTKKIFLGILLLFLIQPVFGATINAVTSFSGGVTTVELRAAGFTNMYGYQVDVVHVTGMTFTGITYSEAVLGKFSGPQQQFCIPRANLNVESTAVRNIACTRTVSGEINTSNLSDNLLATLTFSGAGTISLANVLVSDAYSSQISATPLTCSIEQFVCITDSDCHEVPVDNPITTDQCLNAGSCNSSCSNTTGIDDCLPDAEIHFQCVCGLEISSSGYCCGDPGSLVQELTCNDGDTCTTDSAYYENGVCGGSGSCVYTAIPGCGTICGNGTCDAGENENICAEDCGSGGGDGGGGDSGGDGGGGDSGGNDSGNDGDGGGNGGGGGGGGLGSEGYKALTRELT
ncbi:MAG: hypothetical protein NUV57_04435, partial [archaeon]|nr:hypothetical protein [archaeon]